MSLACSFSKEEDCPHDGELHKACFMQRLQIKSWYPFWVFHLPFVFPGNSAVSLFWIWRKNSSPAIQARDRLMLRWQPNERNSTLIWISFELIDWNRPDSLGKNTGLRQFPLKLMFSLQHCSCLLFSSCLLKDKAGISLSFNQHILRKGQNQQWIYPSNIIVCVSKTWYSLYCSTDVQK